MYVEYRDGDGRRCSLEITRADIHPYAIVVTFPEGGCMAIPPDRYLGIHEVGK